jgi:hypothetical protein
MAIEVDVSVHTFKYASGRLVIAVACVGYPHPGYFAESVRKPLKTKEATAKKGAESKQEAASC